MSVLKNVAKSYLNSRINSLLGGGGAEDIKITLKTDDDEIELPVIPEEYHCTVGNKNEVVSVINAGEFLMKGKTTLKTISFSSFFPAQEYNFAPLGGDPWGYVNKIEDWRLDNKTIDLSIAGSAAEFSCLIESFEFGEQDGSGDVYYKLDLKEYREIGKDPVKKEETSELNGRKKLSFLQKTALNTAKRIINGQSPLQAVSRAVGDSGLTPKQKGYLAISKAVLKKGGISQGDLIGFDNKGNFKVNGAVIK